MKYRNLSVHEVHRHGEETYRKKEGLRKSFLIPPSQTPLNKKNFLRVYLVEPVDSNESHVVRTTTELGCYYVGPLSAGQVLSGSTVA